MGAAKGNKNGAAAYFEPLFEVPMKKEYVRLPESLSIEARENLQAGETFSDLVRVAIERELSQRKNPAKRRGRKPAAD